MVDFVVRLVVLVRVTFLVVAFFTDLTAVAAWVVLDLPAALDVDFLTVFFVVPAGFAADFFAVLTAGFAALAVFAADFTALEAAFFVKLVFLPDLLALADLEVEEMVLDLVDCFLATSALHAWSG